MNTFCVFLEPNAHGIGLTLCNKMTGFCVSPLVVVEQAY
jgi:hypothetical protein